MTAETLQDVETQGDAPLSTGELEGQAPEEAKAAPRLRAREASTETPITEGDSGPSLVERIKAFAMRFLQYWDPPEIWSERRPSVSEVWRYANEASWAPAEGPRRTLGRIYAIGVAVPAYATCSIVAWIIERPARHASAWALTVAFALTPPGQWCRSALATVLRWIADLIA
jgi:hypothetical protein